MSWFRIEGRMPHHRKIAPLSDSAFRLHITAGCWSVEERTEGMIPADIPQTLPSAPRGAALRKVIAQLLERGVWDEMPGGYQLHDFLDYNMSNAQADAKARAGRAGGKQSGKQRRSKNEASASLVLEQKRTTPQAESETDSEDQPDRLISKSDEPFKLPNDWDPGYDVLACTSVPRWAHPELLSRFRGYHCNHGTERTQVNWVQSYVRRAQSEWQGPRRPEKPSDPEAERAQRLAAAKASQERASEAMRALVDAGAAKAANANTRSLSALKEGIG